MNYLGIDNGVSGSLGILSGSGVALEFLEQMTRKVPDYTVAKSTISRILVLPLAKWLIRWLDQAPLTVLLERPLKNPRLFKATESALRAHEATLVALDIALEHAEASGRVLIINGTAVDSRRWQKLYLPEGTSGKQLKVESRRLGLAQFPQVADAINRHGDADSLFIARYALEQIPHVTQDSKRRCAQRNTRRGHPPVRAGSGSDT